MTFDYGYPILMLFLIVMVSTVNMTIYPKTLSFCYPVKHLDGSEKKDYVECNYVEMPNKKLKHVRDFLENWTSQK